MQKQEALMAVNAQSKEVEALQYGRACGKKKGWIKIPWIKATQRTQTHEKRGKGSGREERKLNESSGLQR
jgi:hypothetical protein